MINPPPRRCGVPAAAVLAGLLLAGCSPIPPPDPQDTGTPTSPASGTTAPSTPGATTPARPTPSAPSATPTEAPRAAAVYYLVDTRAGLRLARETRDLVGDPAVAAVEAMIAGPEDSDYSSPWNRQTRVLGVRDRNGTIEVDLSAAARRANTGSAGADLMVQQLVHTVTEVVDPAARVQLLIDGEPAGELWGAVTWDRPIVRAEPADVRLFVQIDTPREGATVSSPLKVAGDAAVFEATVPWRVLDRRGNEVRSGTTMTREGFIFSPYSFEVPLAPGTYIVEVSEDDPSGGQAGEPMRDTKRITIS